MRRRRMALRSPERALVRSVTLPVSASSPEKISAHGATRARSMRAIRVLSTASTRRANHGRAGKYLHDFQGVSSRLDALQAAILRVKLRHIDEWNEARRKLRPGTTNCLPARTASRVRLPIRARLPCFISMLCRSTIVNAYATALNEQGIGAGVHYPVPVHEQPAFRDLGYKPEDFPVTSRIAKRVLSLPIFPEMTRAQVERVAASLIEAVRA